MLGHSQGVRDEEWGEPVRQRVSALGEFFALDAVGAEGSEGAGDWRPIADLLDGPLLDERVTTTTAALEQIVRADVEARVAASTTSLGLFARLLSPAVGAHLLDLPGPDPAGLQWRVPASGPVPLRATTWRSDGLDALLTDVLDPLVSRFVDEYALSEQVVRGNAASALAGSVRMVVLARPHLASAGDALVDRLLDDGLIAGTEQSRRPFVRASCCLYYRIPGGGYCGDCVLAHR